MQVQTQAGTVKSVMKSTVIKIISQSKYILSLFVLMIIIFASIISPSFKSRQYDHNNQAGKHFAYT